MLLLLKKTCFNNIFREEFYYRVMEKKSLLKQVHGSAKYLVKPTEETLDSDSCED